MKRHTHKRRWLFLFVLLAAMMTSGGSIISAPAAEQSGASPEKEGFKKIRISTDQAVMDAKGKRTEFKGHVKVIVDDTKMEADWMSITHQSGLSPDSASTFSENAIERITAKGNVRIMFEDKTAVTDNAVYTPNDKTLILTGPNSKISSGKDFITGNKIILDRINQTFTVESDPGKQVEAVFHEKEKN
jgi:lipopolysaccharide export system protein LptA